MTENKAIVHTESESGEKLAIHAHLTIKLRVEKAPAKETFDATYYIYLLDEAGSKIDVAKRLTKTFGETGHYDWGWHIDHERVKKALHTDGSLLVVADIEFHAPDDKVTPARKGDLISKWHDSIGKLLEKRTNSDCTIVVGGKRLKAHRLILAAISPIFEAMFGNDGFQEAQDGIVRIDDQPGMLKDSSAKPYRALLFYAYKGWVDWTLFGDCKRDVLILACKYLIDDLKRHVEEMLIDEIDAESFTELALLADTYSCDELKKACVEYVSRNPAVTVDSLLRLVRESKSAAEEGGTK